MVSSVKLILKKQNPRRLNKAQRALDKNHNDYKTAAKTFLHTKRNSFSLLFFYTVNSFGKHGTRTCGKETWMLRKQTLQGAWSPRTELFTLWTRSWAGARPAGRASGPCLLLSWKCQASASCKGPSRSQLGLSVSPSVCPSILHLCSRLSTSCLFLRALVFDGAANSSYDCDLWLHCPSSRAAASFLPTGRKARESPWTLVREVALQVYRGKQAGWSCLERVPQAWCYSASSLSTCHIKPSLLWSTVTFAPAVCPRTLPSAD